MRVKIALFLMLLGTFGLQAQKYTTAVGGRLGSGIGLTVQQKLWKKTTFEGILNQKFKQDEIVFTALIERHQGLLGKRLNFYLGAGPHFGWNGDFEKTEKGMAGLTGIAGLEFTLGRLNLSWDFKPPSTSLAEHKPLPPKQRSVCATFLSNPKRKKSIGNSGRKKKEKGRKRNNKTLSVSN